MSAGVSGDTDRRDDDDGSGETGRATAPRLVAPSTECTSGEPPPPVRLLREYKGPTVSDLERDDVADRLPGRVTSALVHLEHGDLAAAEGELPGQFAPILPGPRRTLTWWGRCWRWLALALVLLLAIGLASLAC